MSEIIRPGSPDANGEIWAHAKEPSPYSLDLSRFFRMRVTFQDFDDADTQEDLNLGTLFASKGFPPVEDLIAGEFYVDLVQTWGGGTINAATMLLGQTAGTNGFLTSTNLFTGQTLGFKQTPAATLFARRLYATSAAAGVFGMFMRLDTTAGNINTLTSGIVDIYLPFSFAAAHRAA